MESAERYGNETCSQSHSLNGVTILCLAVVVVQCQVAQVLKMLKELELVCLVVEVEGVDLVEEHLVYWAEVVVAQKAGVSKISQY